MDFYHCLLDKQADLLVQVLEKVLVQVVAMEVELVEE
jgi:hypothetical protein